MSLAKIICARWDSWGVWATPGAALDDPGGPFQLRVFHDDIKGIASITFSLAQLLTPDFGLFFTSGMFPSRLGQPLSTHMRGDSAPAKGQL